MAKVYRDMSIPYTDSEIEKISKIFRSLSTYQPESGGTVSADEIQAVIDAAGMERDAEQVQAYKDYWIRHFEGRVILDGVILGLKNVHNNDTFAQSLAELCDKDSDGFITEDEFANILNLMIIHDPKLAGMNVGFDCFAKEADTNFDGRVSVQECKEWVEKKMKKGVEQVN